MPIADIRSSKKIDFFLVIIQSDNERLLHKPTYRYLGQCKYDYQSIERYPIKLPPIDGYVTYAQHWLPFQQKSIP